MISPVTWLLRQIFDPDPLPIMAQVNAHTRKIIERSEKFGRCADGLRNVLMEERQASVVRRKAPNGKAKP